MSLYAFINSGGITGKIIFIKGDSDQKGKYIFDGMSVKDVKAKYSHNNLKYARGVKDADIIVLPDDSNGLLQSHIKVKKKHAKIYTFSKFVSIVGDGEYIDDKVPKKEESLSTKQTNIVQRKQQEDSSEVNDDDEIMFDIQEYIYKRVSELNDKVLLTDGSGLYFRSGKLDQDSVKKVRIFIQHFINPVWVQLMERDKSALYSKKDKILSYLNYMSSILRILLNVINKWRSQTKKAFPSMFTKYDRVPSFIPMYKSGDVNYLSVHRLVTLRDLKGIFEYTDVENENWVKNLINMEVICTLLKQRVEHFVEEFELSFITWVETVRAKGGFRFDEKELMSPIFYIEDYVYACYIVTIQDKPFEEKSNLFKYLDECNKSFNIWSSSTDKGNVVERSKLLLDAIYSNSLVWSLLPIIYPLQCKEITRVPHPVGFKMMVNRLERLEVYNVSAFIPSFDN